MGLQPGPWTLDISPPNSKVVGVVESGVSKGKGVSFLNPDPSKGII